MNTDFLGNFLDIRGTFSGLFIPPRNAAKPDRSWNWKNNSYWYHMRFWSCRRFEGVIKVFISKYSILWLVLRMLWWIMAFYVEKINSNGGINLGFDECSFWQGSASKVGTLSLHSKIRSHRVLSKALNSICSCPAGQLPSVNMSSSMKVDECSPEKNTGPGPLKVEIARNWFKSCWKAVWGLMKPSPNTIVEKCI